MDSAAHGPRAREPSRLPLGSLTSAALRPHAFMSFGFFPSVCPLVRSRSSSFVEFRKEGRKDIL